MRSLFIKRHKVTFPLSYFSVKKSTKSQQGGLTPSSFRTSCGVHELVAISSAWRVRVTNSKAKVGGFALSEISAIPRVRTYHTRKPSRFVHALSARPHNRVGGREFSLYADEIRAFCQPSPVGEGDARSVTDEESFYKET